VCRSSSTSLSQGHYESHTTIRGKTGCPRCPSRTDPTGQDITAQALNSSCGPKIRVERSSEDSTSTECDHFIVLLYPLCPQVVLQWRQEITHAMMIQPGDLIASQPASAEATEERRMIDVQMMLDQTREELM
jgi:hypothetical protein